MKNKIYLLFALLCASMMSWAFQYCDFPTGHLGNADFGDPSGRVLLTLQKDGNNVIVKLKNNNANGNPQTGLNYMWVNATDATNNDATYGSHSAANAEEISVTVEFGSAKDSYTFNNIHWAYDGFGGEWAIDGLTVAASELCTAASKPSPELSLNATSKTLEKDDVAETFQIVATKVSGSGVVSYESNAEGVATVSNTGLITAVGPGTATITVSVAENEDFAAESKTLTVEVIDWTSIAWLANSNESYKLYISPDISDSFGGKRIEGSNLWVGFPSAAFGDCSIDYTAVGAGVSFPLSNFTSYKSQFTMVCQGTTYTFTVYRKFDGVNLAKGMPTYAGATALPKAEANDGNKGSRWASGGGAKHYPQYGDVAEDWWVVDLGAMYEINSIKTLYEGATPKNYSFYTSPNNDSWIEIDSYNAVPHVGNTDADYNEYTYSPGKVGRYVKIFAREAIQANFAYGISIWEFEVYGQPAENVDVNAPVLASAAVSGTPTASQVQIAVSATDTEGAVTLYRVKDSSNGIDHNCLVDAGIITINDLSEGTNYSFTITALDNIGNQSNAIVVNASTAADPTMPQVAAPTPPVRSADDVRAIYADAYANILAHPFDKDGFGGMTLYMEKNIGGESCLIYDRSGSAPVFTTWGMYNDGGDAIIAAAGYSDPDDASHKGVYATSMEYMHIDIWSLQACTTILIRINDGQRTGGLRLSHNGEGWQSYDIPLSEFEAGANINNVRWFKFEAFDAITGKVAIANVYFWKAASGVKSVSAAVNDPAMGTASVTKNDAPVTEVATGSTVTFSATPNTGYVFVNWSNGETNASFDAEVTSNMNLTANFRALGNIYCNTLVHSSNGGQEHDAYVTMKRSGENEYQLIVRTTEALSNFGGTNFYKPNNVHVIDIRNQGVLSNNNHTLTVTFSCDKEPYMTDPLYVVLQGGFEAQFPQLTNIEYSQPCADPEVTAIELNKTAATLDMGNTLTLVPSFTPAYMSADIEWLTSDDAVATVANGVVTPVAPGTATITAKISETVKATCAVTVQAAASHNWYGYGTSQDLDYTYRIEYTTDHHIVAHVKRQGYIVGLVAASMEINKNNVWTTINVTEGEEEGWAKGTTTLTYTAGDNVHILIQSASSGPLSKIEFDYEVGSDNVMPTIVPSTLALSNTSITMGLSDADVQLTAEIHHRDAANKTISWTSDDESVVTVVDGLVHPVGVGTTTVHAATFNEISATCEVTVVGALEPTIFWGSGEDAGISILYSITRNADHTLTYAVEALHNKDGFELQVNDGDDYQNATLNEGVYTWSSTATYTDGNAFNGFFYMPFAGGAGRVDFHYVVGSESEKGNMPIRLYEDQDNSFMITASDGLIRDVKVTRSFTAGDLYTLVLPFDVDAAQTAAQLPGQLTKLNNSYVKENGDLRINFVDASAVEAGVPYLYQPSANVTNPAFVGVAVSKDLNPSEPADNYAKYYGIYAPMDGDALHAKTNAYVLGPDQYLYAVSDLPATQTMAALRAYFVLNFPSAPAGAPKQLAKVVFNSTETETTTNMENVQTDHTCTKVIVNGQLLIIRDGKMYNVQGQLVK